MNLERSSGVLLHPTSLPGRYGIGDLGEEARRFVDWLQEAGQTWWQVLPLGPTGYGDSPYQSFSAFSGNPYLVSLDVLKAEGLFSEEDLREVPPFDPSKIDYGWIYIWKYQKLDEAYRAFRSGRAPHLAGDFTQFKSQQAFWLDDFSLFMAIKATQPTQDPFGNPCMGAPWNAWPEALRCRELQALQDFRTAFADEIDAICFYQFLFFRQWDSLRSYAHEKGIRILGDLPIFVAMDSADAWSNPDQFYFDEHGQPLVVAGVPPDYFSETGQLWGNPLYRWDVMQARGFDWWIERLRCSMSLYDALRIDHFRGFEAYWEIPMPAENAISGQWVKAPGEALFAAVRSALGELPIVAEDLGVITPEVEALRDRCGFPGMAILQFAFAGGEDWKNNAFLPEHLRVHQVVYTGTHDNDTTRGWYTLASEAERMHLSGYVSSQEATTLAWEMITLAWKSRASWAIAPLQDVLNLDTSARMNLPGRLGGNWQWRFQQEMLSPFVARRLKQLTESTKRNRV